MIMQITKQQHDLTLKVRKRWPKASGDTLVFKGADGKYYRTTETGMRGAKEIFQFNKQYKTSIDSQQPLL